MQLPARVVQFGSRTHLFPPLNLRSTSQPGIPQFGSFIPLLPAPNAPLGGINFRRCMVTRHRLCISPLPVGPTHAAPPPAVAPGGVSSERINPQTSPTIARTCFTGSRVQFDGSW